MEPQDDNFDLFVDSIPPGTLKAPTNTPAPVPQPPVDNQAGYGAPTPPPAAAPPVYAPQVPAAPPAAPVFVPSVPVAPPASLPVFGPATQPSPPPPKRSHLGAIVSVLLVLIAINALVVAHLKGLISFPDLTSSGSSQNAEKPAIAEAKKVNEPIAPNAKGPVVPGGNAADTAKNAGPAQPKVQQPAQPKVQPQVQPKGQPPVQPQPQPAAKPRPFKSTRDVLAAVQSHLLKVPEDERKFQRYLTLVHLYNDKGISDKQLDEYRTALTSLVRYLRPTKEVRIEPIDPAKVVLCLDLRTAGWDAPGIWLDVLKQYPYGLVYSEAKDLEMADLGKDISELSGSDVPIVRLDWFLFATGRGTLSTRLGPPEENSLLPPAITALNKCYVQDVTLEQAARELGLANGNRLREAVQSSELLRNRGLAPFQVDGGVVSRTVWSSLTRGTSACQEAGLQLGLGSVYADIR